MSPPNTASPMSAQQQPSSSADSQLQSAAAETEAASPASPLPASATVPLKRAAPEDGAIQDHAPAVPSPLNPDAASAANGGQGASSVTTTSAAAVRPAAPIVREQREKKVSLKKREAAEAIASTSKGSSQVSGTTGNAGANGTGGTGSKVGDGGSDADGRHKSSVAAGGSGKKGAAGKKQAGVASSPLPLLRYHIPRPEPHDFYPPTPPVPVVGQVAAGRQFYETTEHVWNRKGFRYIHCIADPGFPSIQYHRQSETEPFYTRFDYSDGSQHIHLDETARCVTTDKGFRMARANVCAREGRWYWECKILSGIKSPPDSGSAAGAGSGAGSGNAKSSNGHVRLGFSRREASLETPVGFDAYSYGLRDAAGQKVHMSRPKDFMPPDEEIREGDVIGLEIDLPGLGMHRKVVEGSYNKAVDVSDNVDPAEAGSQDIIRDRLPIRYKSHLYFESFEYQSTKELEDLMSPGPVATTGAAAEKSGANKAPFPNHPMVTLRTLPNSSIKVYKNGKFIGTPFQDLFAFLPPASKPAASGGQAAAAAREGLDDGMLGYFPSVSVFRGGAAEANFGPHFWFPPPELSDKDGDVEMGDGETGGDGSRRRLRPFAERYDEQIAEDIVYDIIDEVDLWSTDAAAGNGDQQTAGPNKQAAAAKQSSAVLTGSVNVGTLPLAADTGAQRAGEIKEIVQDEEE